MSSKALKCCPNSVWMSMRVTKKKKKSSFSSSLCLDRDGLSPFQFIWYEINQLVRSCDSDDQLFSHLKFVPGENWDKFSKWKFSIDVGVCVGASASHRLNFGLFLLRKTFKGCHAFSCHGLRNKGLTGHLVLPGLLQPSDWPAALWP